MSVVTATLLSGGARIAEPYEVISIDIRRQVNRIPYASLALLDGDASQGKFPMSDAAYFEPGKVIEIQLRYEGKTQDATLFKGPVIRHGIEASPQGSLLRVELKDAAVKLTQARRSAVFRDQSDADVIGKLISEAGGLTAGTIAATQPKHPEVVRYACTAWDFMLTRAEANGLWVLVEDGAISARKADLAGGAKRKFVYGLDEIYDFEFEADAGSQYAKVQASGWDPKKQAPTDPASAEAFALQQGNLDGAALAGAVGYGDIMLSHPAPLAPEELKAWADARMMRSRMSLLRGRLSTVGVPDIKLLDLVEIDGVGARFKGKALVTGVCHRVDPDGWRTDLQFGTAARAFGLEEDVSEAPAGALLPAIRGLHVGVVDKFEDDPAKELRVKVILPGIDATTGSVWARLASPDAGKNRGWFFRPEPGDEVVVGFFNDDPRQPVILGAMFSSKNTPPEDYATPTKENKTRVLASRTGSLLGFIDDKKGSVFVETAAGARILLDDSAKSVQVLDQNGNELKMDSNGIQLKTAKDFKLEATGNVEIKGAKVDLK
jgi:Rhs element Vgr protein